MIERLPPQLPWAPKHCKMASSKFNLLLASSAFLCVVVVSNALEEKSHELKGGCPVQCTVTDSQEVESFRELRNTARLVYFRVNSSLSNISKADDCHDFEIDKNLGKAGMEFVWASSHAEPFFILNKDFKRFALAISTDLVGHLRISVSCMVMNTTTPYKRNAVEAVVSTLLINVSESIGTVCYKANDQFDHHCCKAKKSGTTIHCDLQEQSASIWSKLLLDVAKFIGFFIYLYILFFVSDSYFNTNRRSVDGQIAVSRSDVMDCLHVYCEANRNLLFRAFPWTQRLGQFLYNAVVVPCVFNVNLAFHFTCGWPSFLSAHFAPLHLILYICYLVREVIRFLPAPESAEQQSLQNFACLICLLLLKACFVPEAVHDHVKAVDFHLKLLPRAILVGWKCLFKKFCQYTILSPCGPVAVASVFLVIPVFAVYMVCSLVCVLVCTCRVLLPAFYDDKSCYVRSSLSSRFSVFDRRPRLALSFNSFLFTFSLMGLLNVGAVTSYFLVHVVAYSVMLLSLDHENYLTATCIFLVIYYVCHCFRTLASKYGHLKLVLFECYTKHPQNEHVRQANQDCNIEGGRKEQELKIPGDLYMKVCDKVELKAVNLLLMVRDLVVFLSFVFIVIACVMIFGPLPGEINSFFKVLITLAIGLAPRVSTLLSSSKTDKKKKRKELETQVKRVVEEYFQELAEKQGERVGQEDIYLSDESNDEEGGPFRMSFWSKCQRWLQRHSMVENMPELENRVKRAVEEYFQELVENQNERVEQENIHQSNDPNEEEGGPFRMRMGLENRVKGAVEEYFQELVENQDERVGQEDIHQSDESNEEEGGLFRRSFWSKCHERRLQRHSTEETRLSDQYESVSSTGNIQQWVTSV